METRDGELETWSDTEVMALVREKERKIGIERRESICVLMIGEDKRRRIE